MTDLSDISMEGVQPQGEMQELPLGTYLVRIENTEKKGTKDKFDENGNPHPDNGKNFYLLISQKVYGGPNDGQIEFARLNLWNSNATAVNIAKSELKSIQEATGVASPKSEDFHGKWMILEIKAGVQDPKKRFKHYSAAPASLVEQYKDAPPVASVEPAVHAQVAAQNTAAAASAVPSWAQKK